MHTTKGFIVHQLIYEVELLKMFELMDCKYEVTPTETSYKLDGDDDGEEVEATTFKQLVGSQDTCVILVMTYVVQLEW